MELTISDLSKTYVTAVRSRSLRSLVRPGILEKSALCQVSFSIGPGFYGLLGPNGAGKSTLMKIMAGVLLLDEPTAGLDPKERVELRKKLKALARDRIVLAATHVVSDVEMDADQLLILKSGRLVEKGTMDELKARFDHALGLEDIYLRIFGEGNDGKADVL